MPDKIHPDVRIGHVHLKVSDLARALDFYCGVLGFELTQRYGAQASFGLLCAAGEYAPLFAAKRNDDLFVAAFKNYPAILNSLDRTW